MYSGLHWRNTCRSEVVERVLVVASFRQLVGPCTPVVLRCQRVESCLNTLSRLLERCGPKRYVNRGLAANQLSYYVARLTVLEIDKTMIF